MAIERQLTDFFGDTATKDEATGVVTFNPSKLISNGAVPRWPTPNGVTITPEGTVLAILLRAGERQDTSTDSQLSINGPLVTSTTRSVDGVVKPALAYTFEVTVVNVVGSMMPDPMAI